MVDTEGVVIIVYKMKINLSTKRSKLIILISLFVVFALAGGYLLWRVNQPETVAPEDSMAAPPEGVEGGTTIPFPCDGLVINLPHANYPNRPDRKWGQWVCGQNCMSTPELALICPPNRTFAINGDYLEGIYNMTGLIGRGHVGQTQYKEDFQLSINNLPNDKPVPVRGGSSGYAEEIQPVGEFHIKEGQNSVTMSHLHSCPPEDSPNSVHIYKLCLKELNICETGRWRRDPSGTHEYGALENPIVVEVSDADGLGDAEVTLNGSNLPECEAQLQGGGTSSTVGVSCYYADKSPSNTDDIVILIATGQEDYITSGSYSLSVSWEDGKGIGGSNCNLSSAFTISEEVKNPDWDISKTVVELCVDENTDNPKAKLDYIVTIRNQGEGVGQISTIVDMLDEKVLEEYIRSIGNNGVFEDGTIVWTLSEGDGEFSSGQSRTYTYSYIVPTEAFGVYNNTVEATPTVGSSLIANASISADCIILEIPEEETEEPEEDLSEVGEPEEDLPQTGIFDNSQTVILIGLGLLVLGFSWTEIGRRVFVLSEGVVSKFKVTIRDVREEGRLKKDIRRKKSFEKRVVKD